MLATVFTKAVDDRWRGTLIATIAVGVLLLGGLAAYREIDLSVYTDLPLAMRSVMNIPGDADVASLAFGVIYGLLAAMTLASLALSMGAASIAGEEQNGTLGLLLASPRSRTQILVSKLTAMVVVLTLGAIVLWIAAEVAPELLGVDMSSTSSFALVLHMFANALMFGCLAAAIGAWTGNRIAAVGGAAGMMIVSYVAVGLLPLANATRGLLKAVPWYYFDGSQPLSNGINLGHLSVQFGAAALLVTAAFVGVSRRDLRQAGATGTSILDRLRENPRTAQLVERLAGRSRISRIATKAASENQAVLFITSAVMFSTMGVLMGPMFKAIEGSLATFSQDLPDNLLAFVGGGDISTPEGWYQVESLGLMAPIAVMLVTVTLGSRALAGEEARRTMGLLLANPVSRGQVVLEKAAAMAVHAVVVGTATFAGIAAGSLVAGLGMSIANIGAACVLLTLLGLMFGALSLAIGAALGSVRNAMVGTIAVAASLYFVNALLTIASSLAGWSVVSPFHWYLGHDPLVNGMHWGYAALFLAITVTLVGASMLLFERRDLRRG